MAPRDVCGLRVTALRLLRASVPVGELEARRVRLRQGYSWQAALRRLLLLYEEVLRTPAAVQRMVGFDARL